MFRSIKLELVLAAAMSLLLTTAFAAPPIDYVEGQIHREATAGLSDAQLEKILTKAKGRSVASWSRSMPISLRCHPRRRMPSYEPCPITRMSSMRKRTGWWS